MEVRANQASKSSVAGLTMKFKGAVGDTGKMTVWNHSRLTKEASRLASERLLGF